MRQSPSDLTRVSATKEWERYKQRDLPSTLEGFVGRCSVVVEFPSYFSDQDSRGELMACVMARRWPPLNKALVHIWWALGEHILQ